MKFFEMPKPFCFTHRFCGVLSLVLGLLFVANVPPGQAQTGPVLFEDDFNATALDTARWNIYDSTYFIHRTQMGNRPVLTGENGTTFARLNLNTYNSDPTYGSSNLKGTEMFSKANFPVGQGGVEYEARVRGTNIAPGLVFAFYTFGAKGTWPDTYLWDEVDYELLGNYPTNRLWINVWDDYNPQRGGLNEASQPYVDGLNWNGWNTYKVRAYPFVTQWFVNDVLVRQSYNIVPADPMGVRFNIWAPNSTWTAAYNSAIAPASSSNNTTYYFDVDYVRVRSLPTGSIGNGTGLAATYFDNADFSGATVARTDPNVNFNWDDGSPDAAIAPDTFSARWSGQVQAQFSETYTFTTRSDDGVRLWVNGQKLIDNWTDHGPTDDTATIALVAGTRYDIVLEYYEGGFGAIVQLFWSSPSTPQRIIPQSQLYPAQIVAPTPTPTATPTATPTPGAGVGSGLSAIYYNNANFTGTTVKRTDAQINFDWDNGSPNAAIAPDTFSARWTGQVQAQWSQTYTFYARADDGVRVWVNGQKLIDAWKDQGATEYSGNITLVAGTKYDIIVEYYENLFGATMQLRWSSPSTPKALIPQSQLFPAEVTTPTPTATPTPTSPPGGGGTGDGLSAAYYNNRDFTGTSIARVDPQINFNWGNGSPDAAIAPDTFSARWSGQVQAQFSETYTFTTRGDDGVRLWVNGQKLIDNWTIHGTTEDNGSIALVAGTKYDIRLEYFEEAFGANIQLLWSSPSTQRTSIPQAQLYSQTVAAARMATTSAGSTLRVAPVKPGASPLSMGVASAGRSLVRLNFSVALDADVADDASRYRVEVNGVKIDIESVSYIASRNMLSLGLPEGVLSKGARVKVLWSGLRDRRGRAVANGSWQGIAN